MREFIKECWPQLIMLIAASIIFSIAGAVIGNYIRTVCIGG